MDKIKIVKLTGQPVSAEMQDLLQRLAENQYVDIDEINATKEIQIARSNVDYSRPSIQLDNRSEIQAYILNILNNYGSARIDEQGINVYNGNVNKESRLDIVIGLPGSGKSSAIVNTISAEFNSKVIDNDEAKKRIPQYNDGWGAGVVHKESQMISDAAFRVAIARHENIVLPKVGSDVNKLLKTYIEPAKEAGYHVNVHYVDLAREKALGRMINRFIEEGRFLDPNIIDKYDNERDGNKIEQTYNQLKENSMISGLSRWDNDVARGEPPVLLESTNLTGDYITYARKEREGNSYAKGEHNAESIYGDSRSAGRNRGNELPGSNQHEAGWSKDNRGYGAGGSNRGNGQILQINDQQQKYSVREKLSANVAFIEQRQKNDHTAERHHEEWSR